MTTKSPQQPRASLSWPDVSKPSTGHQPPSGYPEQQWGGPSYGRPPSPSAGGGARIVLLVAILLAITVAAGVLGWLIFR